MNKCIMLGRLCRDVELRKDDNDKAFARFGIAVNRRFKNADGNYDADFINCSAFGATAEFINKYFAKGNMIGIVGRWATGSYTNSEGVKIYTNDLIVEEAYFAGGGSSEKADGSSDEKPEEPEETMESASDDDLPW